MEKPHQIEVTHESHYAPIRNPDQSQAIALVWRKDADGTPILIQVTDEGLRAIGIDPNEGRTAPDTAPQGGEDETPQAESSPPPNPPLPRLRRPRRLTWAA